MKYNIDGSMQRDMIKLVVKGYSQRYRIYYDETYAPVARLDIIRTLIALETRKRWLLYQPNVKLACSNGDLKEGVYVG